MDSSCQAFLSMEFSRQEYWSGLPCPSPGDLPDPGIEPGSPTLWADSLLSESLLQRLPNAPTASLSSSDTWRTNRSPGSHGPSGRAACTTARTCGRVFSCSESHQNSQLFDPWIGKIPWRRERLPTPVFWPGEFHGLNSLWDCQELDMTEWLSLSFRSLSKWAIVTHPKWGLCCPPNPKRLNRCHAPFLVVRGPGCNNLSFILEKNLPPHPTPPDPWKSHRGRRCLNFCQIYFCLKFCQISHPLACKHHYW